MLTQLTAREASLVIASALSRTFIGAKELQQVLEQDHSQNGGIFPSQPQALTLAGVTGEEGAVPVELQALFPLTYEFIVANT